MNNVEDQLADLMVHPPNGLERSTVIGAGAGDLVASVDSRFGPLWIAWSSIGVTALTPAFASPTIESFLDLGHEAPRLSRFRHVCLHDYAPSPICLDLRKRRRGSSAIGPVIHRNSRPTRRERNRSSGADSARRSRHERYPVL